MAGHLVGARAVIYKIKQFYGFLLTRLRLYRPQSGKTEKMCPPILIPDKARLRMQKQTKNVLRGPPFSLDMASNYYEYYLLLRRQFLE